MNLGFFKDEGISPSLEGTSMNRNAFLSLLLFFSLLSLVCSANGVAGTLQDVTKRGNLIAGVKTEYPPLGFLDNKGVNKGFDIDITRALAKQLFGKDAAVQFVPVLAENQITFLTSGKIDIVVGIDANEEIKRQVDCSVPYFISGQSILVRSESKVTEYQELAGKKVGTIQGSNGDTAVGELVPTAQRITFEHPSEALQALTEHRVEAFVEDYVPLYNLLQKNRGLRIAGLQPFSPAPYCIGVKKGDQEWLSFINSALEKMKESGEYKKLLDKWFGLEAGVLWRLFRK
jgi:polar amino acid transport system substrate-binding protein